MVIIIFKPVSLEDKPIFDAVFQARRYEGAESTFTNLFMWEDCYNITWAEDEDFLYIKPTLDGQSYCLAPLPLTGDLTGMEKALDKLIDYFAQNNLPFIMAGVTKDMLGLITSLQPDTFTVTENREVFDYVYRAEDLINLKGRKYHRKRNHIRNFKKNYPDYEYLPLTEDLTEACMQFAIEWCEKKGCLPEEKKNIICERDALIKALRHFNDLDFKGGVILINNKVAAFTFGEAINEDTVVIHVEKAEQDIKGLYAIINQEFCKNTWGHMKYINREEDLGIPGLRKAKESYYPVKMIAKYTLTLE